MSIKHTSPWFAAVALFAAVSACSGDPTESGGASTATDQQADEAGRVCRADADCPERERCTVEGGAGCERPIGCVGHCVVDTRVTCGETLCDDGLVCCNESCGICAPPDGTCTEQLCLKKEPPVVVLPPPSNTCGDAICERGEVCCDARCGLCAPEGAACPRDACVGPQPVVCGATTCDPGGTCCNADRGQCAPEGQACSDVFPTTSLPE